jgi:L-malate glycosyltransferase
MIVGMVANLSSRVKKHRLFIEAAAKIGTSFPVEWRIYGDDPSRGGQSRADAYVNSLHELARATGIENRLRFPGHLPPEQIMCEIDLLVHPTDVESFGRVVVEAMAAGLPVVGVKGGGVAEIITHGKTGLLAQLDDSADLARCIASVLNDPELARALGANGKAEAESKYRIETCAENVRRVYEELLSSNIEAPNGPDESGRLASACERLATKME